MIRVVTLLFKTSSVLVYHTVDRCSAGGRLRNWEGGELRSSEGGGLRSWEGSRLTGSEGGV